jgi:hypothetical protein
MKQNPDPNHKMKPQLEFLTPSQAATREKVSVRRMQQLLQDGRVIGAFLINGVYVIPGNFTIAPGKTNTGPKRRNEPIDNG